MTTEVNDTIEQYEISGTGPYAFSFRIFDEDDLTVTALETGEVDPVTLTVNSHFTVSGVNDEDGGTITLINSAETTYDGYTLDIRSNVVVDQPTSIKNQGSFSPVVHEKAFDRLNRQIQDLSRKVKQAFRYPDNVDLDAKMTSRSSWLERYLFVNASGIIEPAIALSNTLTQSIFNAFYYLTDDHKRTAAEIAATVTPTSYFVDTTDYYNIRRYFNGTMDDGADISTATGTAISLYKEAKIPAGSFTANTALPPMASRSTIRGAGPGATRITTTLAAGNWLEFNNSAGDFDDGVVLEDFYIEGPNSGAANGIHLEGVVWANSRIANVHAVNFGNRGFNFIDCLTMNAINIKAQGNNGIGIYIERSNGMNLIAPSSESNGSHGLMWAQAGSAGENVGGRLIGYHAEENDGHALYLRQKTDIEILGGWMQVAGLSGTPTYGAIAIEDCSRIQVVSPFLTTGGTATNLAGLLLDGCLLSDFLVKCSGFAANRDIVEDADSGRNEFNGRGGGSQGRLGFTTSSTTGSVFNNPCGSGGSYGKEVRAGYHDLMTIAGVSKFRVGSTGPIVTGASGATGYQNPLWLGSVALWVDSTATLRIKNSTPTSDTDGVVVGAQT